MAAKTWRQVLLRLNMLYRQWQILKQLVQISNSLEKSSLPRYKWSLPIVSPKWNVKFITPNLLIFFVLLWVFLIFRCRPSKWPRITWSAFFFHVRDYHQVTITFQFTLVIVYVCYCGLSEILQSQMPLFRRPVHPVSRTLNDQYSSYNELDNVLFINFT